MKSRSELALNGSVRKPCLRQALSESHISGESFPRLLRSESGTILHILRSPTVEQTEQLDEVSCPSLSDSYDERLMQLLDCHRSPKYLDEVTGAVYAPYTPPVPLECDRSLSEILSRVQAGTSANNAQEQKSPNKQPNDPQYLFGPSDSFPAHIARRPEVRRINFDLHQTNLENITPPSELQNVYHSTPLPRGQTSAENQSATMSSGYYSNTSTPIFQPNIIYSGENLNDVSIPTYAEFSRRDHTDPSEMLENISSKVIRSSSPPRSCICKRKRKYNQSYTRLEDISAPSECLQDQSMPTQTFRPIVVTPHRPQGRAVVCKRTINFPDEQIADVSTPKFESTRIDMTNECLEDVSKPSQFTSTSQSQQRPQTVRPKSNLQNSMRSEKLEDISMPCSPNLDYSQIVYTNINSSFPDERLMDVSAPVFESTPMQSQERRQYQNIESVSSPGLVQYSACSPNEFIIDESMPSFSSPLECSRKQRTNQCQMSYPSENLENITSPGYDAQCSRQATATTNFSDQKSAITDSRYCRPITPRQRVISTAYSSEYLNNVSAPVFEKSSPRQNQQTPLTGSRYYRPMNQRQRVISNTYSCENLNDISVPMFEKSSPRQNQTPLAGPIYCRPTPPRQREISNTYSSENLNDISVPVFDKSSPLLNQETPRPGSRYCRANNQIQREISNMNSPENINNISAPVFEKSSPRQNQQTPLYCRPIPPRQREISNTYSCENLNDISVPVFETSTPRQIQQSPLTAPIYCRPIYQRQREISNTYSSENLNDISIPEFEKSSQPTNYGQSRSESRSHKSLKRFFSRSKSRSPARDNRQSPVQSKKSNRVQIQKEYTTDASSEYLDDITPPDSHQYSTLNKSKSQYMNPSSEQTPVRSRQVPKPIQKQRDVSAKSNNRSANKSPSTHQSRLSKERIRNISKSDLERIKRRLILPTERLEDQSMPSMAGSPQITSTPIPTRREVYNTPCIRHNDTSNPSANSHISALVNCLNNMLISHFGVTMSPQKVSTLTKEQLNDITIPASCDSPSQYILTITPNEQIQDVTMPSLPPDSKCVTQEKLEDISMPTLEDCIYPEQSGINFDINNPNHRGVYVCEYHENECPPRQMYECEFTTSPFNNNNQQQQLIENESPPRFITVSRSPSGTDSNDSESEKKESNLKSFLNTTKDVFSKLGESKQTLQKQTLSPETTKRETTPVVPIPGTLRSLQNFRSFLSTNKPDESGKTDKSNKFHDKVLNSISKPDFTPTKTAEETTTLENISAPEFNSTAISQDQPAENSKEEKTATLPRPGTLNGFKNIKKFAELARNSVKERERKKLESTRLEDISSPTFDLTPSQSLENLEEQKPTTSAQPSKNQHEKQKEHKKENTTKDSNVDYVQNTSAPSFASTPESIPQMRNYKTPTRAKHNQESTTSIPKMRAYSTSKIYNGPSTSRGSPTNKSSTSLGSRKRQAPLSKEPQQQKSTPMIKNSRTQTSRAVLWNEIDARRIRAPSTPRQPQIYQQTQPTYEVCSSCYQVCGPPSYYYVNYDPCQTQHPEIVYEYVCEMCEGRQRSRSS